MADVRVQPDVQLKGTPDGTTFDLLRTAGVGDAAAATGLLASPGYLYNGTTWERMRTSDALSAAPNTKTGVQVVGIGPGFDLKLNPSNLGTALNSAITNTVDGADVYTYYVGTGTTGTIIFETSADDTNWITASYILKVGTDVVVAGAVTPAAGDIYIVRTTGVRQVRVRTASTLGATVAIKTTGSVGAALIKGIDVGPAPHNFGYVIATKTAQYTTTQTGTALWTPASGKKLCILGYQIQAGGTTAGTMQLWFGASADTTYTRGTDSAIFDGEFAPSATLKPGVVANGVWSSITVDYVLRVTDSAAVNPLTVAVWGYEY